MIAVVRPTMVIVVFAFHTILVNGTIFDVFFSN